MELERLDRFVENLNTEKRLNQFELMVMIAKMYYMENLTQSEIARKLDMSRSNVSRLLISCRELGIVEITINDSSIKSFELKRKIKNRFGVKDVIITPLLDDRAANILNAGKAAAKYVSDILADHMSIAIGWGSTIYKMVNAYTYHSANGVDVYQLMGGTNIKESHKDGIQLTIDFAKKVGGVPHFFNAPLVVQNSELKELLMNESTIREHLDQAGRSDVAIVALGTNDPEHSSLVLAGCITKEQSNRLYKEGICTNIMGQHMDIYGKLSNKELNDNVMGLTMDQFKKIKLKIGVASGDEKVRPIISALMGGYINTLITDERTASLVEQYADEQKIYNPFSG